MHHFEKAAIAGMLLNPKKIPFVLEVVTSEHFKDSNAKKIIEAFENAHEKKLPCDAVTLLDAGISERVLDEIIASQFESDNAVYYAQQLQLKKMRADVAREIAQIANDKTLSAVEVIARSQAVILKSSHHVTEDEKTDSQSIKEIVASEDAQLKERIKQGKKILGLSTGLGAIDRIVDGLRPGHLIVIGGYTSAGKTTLALNFIATAIREAGRCVVFSLEMTKPQIYRKIISIMANVPQDKQRLHDYTQSQQIRIDAAKNDYDIADIDIYGKKNQIDDIIVEMQKQNIARSVDVFMLDFLQLVQAFDNSSEYTAMSEAITKLQTVAKELDACVIVLSQISNEHAKSGGGSQMMGFKGSGSIAAAADLALELRRGCDDDEWVKKQNAREDLPVTLAVKKNRHGNVGSIDLKYNSHIGLMEEVHPI